jgi:hypothetical protein
MRLLAVILLALPSLAEAAAGCSLRNPDEDIRSFFPEVTDYVVHAVSFRNQGADHTALGRHIHDELDGLYETDDVPYSLYVVRGASGTLGYVFGTNQRGRYSNLQVIAVTDADLDLKTVYLQTLRSPAFQSLQSPAFLEALAQVDLATFPNLASCYRDGDCGKAPVVDPTGGAEAEDYRHILRALAKLSGLQTLLLHPGSLTPPAARHARAEWIGNHQGVEHSRTVAENPRLLPAAEAKLPPDTPVISWHHATGIRAYPLSAMEQTPVVLDHVDGQHVAVTWSVPSQQAALFTIQEKDAFHFSGDLLFGHRVLVDNATGSQWSQRTGEAVYGSRAGEILPAVTGVEVTRLSELGDGTVWVLAPQ